jgi:hypothetical protein
MVLALLAGRKTVTRRMSKQWDSLVVGQRLWVRETFAREDLGPDEYNRLVWRADRCARLIDSPTSWSEIEYLPSDYEPKRWTPAIHMPRWASRTLLEVTEPVRVERAHDITGDEVLREGLPRHLCNDARGCDTSYGCDLLVERFAALWQQINNRPPKPGKPDGRWEANPLVHRIAFKVLEVKR